jgi:predicted nuclease with RNAse H fold
MRELPFVGIDLTAGGRASDIAALDAMGNRVAFLQATTDDEILAVLRDLRGRVVAVDSPMALPLGMCCLEQSCDCTSIGPGPGRSAERALASLGIPCFWTTKRTIIKSMVYRAIRLKALLEDAGLTVLEVYPYAVKRILLGRVLPKKSSVAGLLALMVGARRELPDCCWPEPWTPGHDQLDALYCAITARLYERGQTDALGDPAEVPIIVPRVPHSIDTRA